MPAALDVNREAVRTLAVAVGVREAARQMGLPESTVKSWSDRGDWLRPIVQPPTVLRASSASIAPAQALQNALADDSKATRAGFSKAARRVSEHLGDKPAEKLLERDTATSGRSWADVASKVHGWQDKQGESTNVMVNVSILSQ